MNYYRCQCGKRQIWSTDGPGPDCHGCEKCGTTFAQSPSGHSPLRAHPPERIRQRFSPDTGEPTHRVCGACGERLPNEPAEEAAP